MTGRRRWTAALAPIVAVAVVGAGAAVAIKWEADRWVPAGGSRSVSVSCIGSEVDCERLAAEMMSRPPIGGSGFVLARNADGSCLAG